MKSGPNTIKYEDVNPLLRKFNSTLKLGRTNKAFKEINNNDFIVGVLYGEIDELSAHYRIINKSHPVYIGKELWYRITGFPNFYNKLVIELHKSITNLDTKDLLKNGCLSLEEEIKNSPFFNF